MVLKSVNVIVSGLLATALTLGATSIQTVFAQSGTDRAIFQEEKQMMQLDQNQAQQLEQQKQSYLQQVNQGDQQRAQYRLYAEKRVQELSKLKAAGGSPSRALAQQKSGELYALEKWLAADEQTREEEQAHLKQLDKSIANLEQATTTTMSNMNSDVNAMREDSQRVAENQKFQQQMQVNNFNELQSEMGAASWGRPPTDGTFNSTGGYGFGGGYGYRGFSRGGGY